MKNERSIGDNVVFTKICSSVTEGRKEFTQTSQKRLSKLVKIYNGIKRQSTPRRPETNGVAESALRRVKEGTAFAPVLSGQPVEWWDCAMECYCYLRMHDKMADGQDSIRETW